MEKLIYFKGYTLLTQTQKALIINTYGDDKSPIPTPYIHFDDKEVFMDSGTGVWEINTLLLTIWNEMSLNERYDILVERIKNGLTPSKTSYGTVEKRMAKKLLEDAIREYNTYGEEEISIYWYGDLVNEFLRVLGFPNDSNKPSIINMLEDDLGKLKDSKIDEFDAVDSPDADIIISEYTQRKKSQTAEVFQEYFFYLKDYSYQLSRNNSLVKELHKKYPFLCKLSAFTWNSGDNTLSINVYDRNNSYKALKIILKELFDRNVLAKDDFIFKD